MPVCEWPSADRALWETAIAPGDVLEDGGARARHAAVTNRKVEQDYGRWLTWCSRREVLLLTTAPADRITPERVKAYVADMAEVNATGTILVRLQALYEISNVFDPERDWQWIRGIQSRVRAQHAPVRSKRARLVGAADLLALGEQLMQSAPALLTDRLRARQFRDGLIIALLAARPLRLRNLAGLELERTLARRGATWWIAVPPEETKTGQFIELPWPDVLIAPLSTYLNEHRRVLCKMRGRWARSIGQAVWVSTHDSPMGPAAIYEAIIGRTSTAFGRPINPHLFRDCAATSIAIEDPAHVRIASQILGHRSAATTEKYYNQAQAIDAARRYQDFLVALRSGTIVEDKEPL